MATDPQAPQSVEEMLIQSAEKPKKAPQRIGIAEAGLSPREAFEAKLRKATDPVDYTLPNVDVTVKVQALTIAQRNERTEMAKRDDGTVDGWALECLFVEAGLVEPQYTAAELANMPELFVDPIYYRIMELTNGRKQIGAQAVDGPTPLHQTSGSARFWATATTGHTNTSKT